MVDPHAMPLIERAQWVLSNICAPWTTTRNEAGEAVLVEDADSLTLIQKFWGYVTPKQVEAVGMLPDLVRELVERPEQMEGS